VREVCEPRLSLSNASQHVRHPFSARKVWFGVSSRSADGRRRHKQAAEHAHAAVLHCQEQLLSTSISDQLESHADDDRKHDVLTEKIVVLGADGCKGKGMLVRPVDDAFAQASHTTT
jgi:hypothetical protein